MTKPLNTTVADAILVQIRTINYWALGAWGAHSIDTTENAVSFRVRGARFGGRISVHHERDQDTYSVCSYLADGSIGDEYTNIHAEGLVRCLDLVIG